MDLSGDQTTGSVLNEQCEECIGAHVLRELCNRVGRSNKKLEPQSSALTEPPEHDLTVLTAFRFI